MADIIDQGNDTADLFLGVALKNARGPEAGHGIGMCLNCSEEVEGDARWCGVECRDDYEKHAARRPV